MKIYMFAFLALLPLVPVRADDASARAGLLGTWQETDDSGKGVSVWVLEANGDSLHVTNSQGDQKLSEIDCKPAGAECEGTDSGKKVKVVMYFNGPTLVQMETEGSNVIKRRFTVADKPDMMDLEIMPLTGHAKPETLHLKRMPVTASK
jgi:hypothetical protein